MHYMLSTKGGGGGGELKMHTHGRARPALGGRRPAVGTGPFDRPQPDLPVGSATSFSPWGDWGDCALTGWPVRAVPASPAKKLVPPSEHYLFPLPSALSSDFLPGRPHVPPPSLVTHHRRRREKKRRASLPDRRQLLLEVRAVVSDVCFSLSRLFFFFSFALSSPAACAAGIFPTLSGGILSRVCQRIAFG